MNKQKQPIKQVIKTYYASKSLTDAQYQLLQESQEKRLLTADKINSKKVTSLTKSSSIAASLLFFILVFAYTYTPTVITAAYADTKIDAEMHNGLQTPIHQWMSDKGIYSPPTQYLVEMGKRCKLDKYDTRHIRIAGSEQGMMHLFFRTGNQPLRWIKHTGTVGEMNWKSIDLREDLTLIVLYTDDMRESAMQNILNEMLPELRKKTDIS
jgi:hypothetical protein